LEKRSCYSIICNAARCISVKETYPLNKGFSKIELFQGLEKKVPTEGVKCFLKVNGDHEIREIV